MEIGVPSVHCTIGKHILWISASYYVMYYECLSLHACVINLCQFMGHLEETQTAETEQRVDGIWPLIDLD